METNEETLLRTDSFVVRDVQFELEMHDTCVMRGGRTMILYTLKREGEALFSGQDFGCAPDHAIDSDVTMLTLLSFLCLTRGGVDVEYFDSYNDAQLDFRENEANDLFETAIDRFPAAREVFGYDPEEVT